MGSNFILKVLKPLKPFLAIKPPQLHPTAGFLCTTRASNTSGGRGNSGQTDGHSGVKFKTVRQMPSFPKSVFSAGTSKRTTEMLKRKEPLALEEPEEKEPHSSRKLQPPDRPLSVAEWKELQESLGNPHRFEIKMIHSLFNSGADLNIAKSLLSFVAMETGTLSYELLLQYLSVCVKGGHDDEVPDVYDIMRGSFPSLETGATSLLIKSFSRTARWKTALSILHEVKKAFTPTARSYGEVIAAAIWHGEKTTAWTLYNELIDLGLSPNQETWAALFKGVGDNNEAEADAMTQAEHQERLLEILQHMRTNQIYPQRSLASSIKAWFESLAGQKWTGSWTSTNLKGQCRCCGSKLESIQLTTEEYHQLKDRVMTDIIQGQDVFNKTTPEELESFKVFVQKMPVFDVVVDGLNVANSGRDRSKQSEMLLAVVSELKRQGLTILVLGRRHMLKPTRSWNKHHMNVIMQKAHCFFTDNISEDDPFLLYAALHSGNHCRFVSRDLMRDHKACLGDRATRQLFFKWQRGHQMVVNGSVAAGKRVRFQSILSYDTIVQTLGDSWHIPYDNTEDRTTYEVPQHWLCLTQTK